MTRIRAGNRLMNSARRAAWHLRPLLFAAVMLLPLKAAAAAPWWCDYFPFLFGCQIATPDTGGSGGPLREVVGFGSNPGNLRMFIYRPAGLAPSRPLVVALHGCTQQAADYDDEPGWVKFADKYRFALLLPQQQAVNNLRKCFNWFQAEDNERDKGEALSISQMIDKAKADLRSDPASVYVTGLSGGGGMAAVMLAAYPERFAGGAIIAGIPYKCAADASEALSQCGVSLSGQLAPMKDLAPAQWGNLVRAASPHRGPFPPVSIWQGASDVTVNPAAQKELVDQWTNVHGIDQTPDADDMLNGYPHKSYKDAQGSVRVETVLVNQLGHGTPIDAGSADTQCGKPAPHILNAGICATYHILRFWKLDTAP